MAVIFEMSCGRGRAEDCRPPLLCGAVISPPEHKTTRVNPSIGINSVQRVNSVIDICPPQPNVQQWIPLVSIGAQSRQ